MPSTCDHEAAAGGAEGGRRNGSGAAEPHDEPRVRQLLRQWRVFPGHRQPQGSRIPIQSVLNNRALHPQPDRVNVITINVVPFPLPASRGSPHLNFVNLHALACLLPLPLPTQLHCNSVTAMEPPCCACSSRRETQQCEPASRVAQIYSAWARSTKVEASGLG